MFFKTLMPLIVTLVLLAAWLAGCQGVHSETLITSTPVISEQTSSSSASSSTPAAISGLMTSTPGFRAVSPTPTNVSSTLTAIPDQPAPTLDLSDYAFPDSIDPAKLYMFYLHGRIIEDQGIPAISPEYGEYEYEAILENLSGYGFLVISEQRTKDTDGFEYASRVTEQVTALLEAGVSAKNITVVGASKGAGITMYVSHFLENEELNFVIMAICAPGVVQDSIQNQTTLYGNVLSIYDASDEYAGSCQDLFTFSEGRGINRSEELILNIGTGHGILYKPLEEWIIPVVQWAGNP